MILNNFTSKITFSCQSPSYFMFLYDLSRLPIYICTLNQMSLNQMSLNQTSLNRTDARFSGPSDLADKFLVPLGNVKSDFACSRSVCHSVDFLIPQM